jgi:hypothetical protein
MFKFFKQNRLKKLKKQYHDYLHQAHEYSTKDRKKSDEFFTKAREVEDKILQIKEIED